MQAFDGCTALKAIYVPVEKKDYYIQSLPGELHSLIVGMGDEVVEQRTL
jgi:hypothetical protein